MSRNNKGQKGESKFNLQMVLDYIEQNGVTRMKDLPENLRNYIYREKLSSKIPFNQGRAEKRLERKEKQFKENRLQDWYNIERILPYLERWAREENTTIEQQAIWGCLELEWQQWCLEHPEYIRR